MPLFDPGAFELLDFDPATGLKLRGDPVFDQRLKLADRESLEQHYELRVSTGHSDRQLVALVPIKPKFEIARVVMPRGPRTESLALYQEHFGVERPGKRMTRLEPTVTGLLGVLGFHQATHKSLLDLAREYEKKEYREWLGQLRGHFEGKTASEILV